MLGVVSSNVLGVVSSNVLGVVSSNVLGVVSSNVLGVVSFRCGGIQCARCTMGSNGNGVVLKAMTQLEFTVVVNHYLDTIVKLQGRFSFFKNVCSCVTLGYLFLSIGWSRPDT